MASDSRKKTPCRQRMVDAGWSVSVEGRWEHVLHRERQRRNFPRCTCGSWTRTAWSAVRRTEGKEGHTETGGRGFDGKRREFVYGREVLGTRTDKRDWVSLGRLSVHILA